VLEIPQLIAKIKEDQSKAISDEVVKSGIEKTVLTKIQDAQAKLKAGTEKIGAIVQKNIETAKAEGDKKTAEEKAKEEKEMDDFKKASLKLEDYKEIVTGKKEVGNLQKKGKNLKTIQKIQELLNNYLEKPIKADGLYGEGTEKAIAEVSKALSLIEPEVKSDGKVMSPLLQAMLMKIEEKGGKEKVKQAFDKVSKEGSGEEKAEKK
jgi:peptidoglycan hydrolase-like protein with peptidoglycan-binding domain